MNNPKEKSPNEAENADTPYLDDLVCALGSWQSDVRETAKREIASLQPETQHYLLQKLERMNQEIVARYHTYLVWQSPHRSRTLPCTFDMLVQVIAEESSDPRFIKPVLNTLFHLEFFEKHLSGKEDDDGRPRWGSFPSRPMIKIQIEIPGKSSFLLEQRLELMRALKRMLTQKSPDTLLSLTGEEQIGLLIPLRSPYRDVELTIFALNILAQSGKESALPTVERLAEKALESENGRRIRQAAQNCLTQIRQRIEAERHSQTLLRPSDAAAFAAPESLLRPAAPTSNEEPPEQLLRPSA